MLRYKRGDFDEDDVSDITAFPADIVNSGIELHPNLNTSGQKLVDDNSGRELPVSGASISFYKLTSKGPTTTTSRFKPTRRGFWDRSSPFEKLLMAVSGFLGCIVIILISILAAQSDNSSTLQVHVSTSRESSKRTPIKPTTLAIALPFCMTAPITAGFTLHLKTPVQKQTYYEIKY